MYSNPKNCFHLFYKSMYLIYKRDKKARTYLTKVGKISTKTMIINNLTQITKTLVFLLERSEVRGERREERGEIG